MDLVSPHFVTLIQNFADCHTPLHPDGARPTVGTGLQHSCSDYFTQSLGFHLWRNAGEPVLKTSQAPVTWSLRDISTAKRLSARRPLVAAVNGARGFRDTDVLIKRYPTVECFASALKNKLKTVGFNLTILVLKALAVNTVPFPVTLLRLPASTQSATP